MIDRNVEFPNRFRMTKVEGTDDIYDLIPAPGEVIAPGDTFSKANMLPDSIPALLGLKMANPQVKDALNVLANVGNLHVWERVRTVTDPIPEVPAGYTLGEETNGDIYVLAGSTQTSIYVLGVTYGDSVSVDKNGNVSIVSPTTKTSVRLKESEGKQIIQSLVGKYVKFGEPAYPDYVKNVLTGVFYIPPTATVTTSNSGASTTYIPVIGYPYTPAIPAGTTTDYLTSTDRNAYPDNVTDAQDAYYTLGDVRGSFALTSLADESWIWAYSDNVIISDDGETVELDNPSTVSLSRISASTAADILIGKFFKFNMSGLTDEPYDQKIYYIPSDATITHAIPSGEKYYRFDLDKYQPVTGHAAIPANTTITYLGQLGDGARIEVGSYVGTGTESADILIGFTPKAVLIPNESSFYSYGSNDSAFILPGLPNQETVKRAEIIDGGFRVYYYSNSSVSRSSYLNSSGRTYRYIAIG